VSDSPTQRRPGFYEFFCGGGMARAGLGDAWRCLFANDFDPRKARACADNRGEAELRLADVATLRPATCPADGEAPTSRPAGARADRDAARWPRSPVMRYKVEVERRPPCRKSTNPPPSAPP
jgi:DNA (cytosine-5)-methyltransferase 1